MQFIISVTVKPNSKKEEYEMSEICLFMYAIYAGIRLPGLNL